MNTVSVVGGGGPEEDNAKGYYCEFDLFGRSLKDVNSTEEAPSTLSMLAIKLVS